MKNYLPCLALLGACTESSPDVLTIDVAATSIEGTFAHGDVAIAFRSESVDQKRASVHFEIDEMPLDIELDLEREVLVEDGHQGSLYRPQLDALVALRDAFAAHAEIVETLEGSVLVRSADRFAEAPEGLVLDRHTSSYAASKAASLTVTAPGCIDDGVTCLSGTSGSTWAVFDEGSNGTCFWVETTYGGSECYGRCGAGCNWLDNDYTWDCLDHDRCLDRFPGSAMSGNVNCGDEFWDAADDYVATYGPLCWSGHSRSTPPYCGDGIVQAGEECDDHNTAGGDLCSATCKREVVALAIVPGSITIDRQQRVQVYAIARMFDQSTRRVTTTAAWTSNNPGVATAANAHVDGVNAGTAVITATYGGVSASVQVSVSANTCHVTINEVQASGATAADEWIEVSNSCTVPFDVTGWTLVYRAATTIGASDSSVLATLAGVMSPGELRLYASASAPSAIVALASATWTHGGSNGALQRTCAGIGLRAGSISVGALVDAVAYGAVTAGHPFAEGGGPAPALDANRSLFRAFDGRDSNNNTTDFALGDAGLATPKATNLR